MWPWFCEDRRSSTKKPHRARRAEVFQQVKAVGRGEGATTYVSSGMVPLEILGGAFPAITQRLVGLGRRRPGFEH